MQRYFAFLFLAVTAFIFSGTAQAETVFQCPNLNTVEQVGSCPSKEEVKAQQERTCMNQRDVDARALLACDDFDTFYQRKAKSLWALQMGGEEQLTYRSCVAGDQRQEKGEAVSMQVKAPERFSWLFCTYSNKESLSIKVGKNCKLTNGEDSMDCGPDGTACSAVCE